MKEFPPFYINQKVICIDNEKADHLKKDKEYICLDIERGCCEWEIYVGIDGDPLNPLQECGKCKRMFPKKENKLFYRVSRFVPIQENFQHITYKAVLEKEEKLIGVN